MNIEIINKILPNIKKYTGLSTAEAETQFKKVGPNSRPAIKHKTWLKHLTDILTEPMIIFLVIATALYFFLGEKLEATILLFSIIPVIMIEFFQEQKTDQAIRILDKIMLQFSLVYRDGKTVSMESKYIVPEDLIYLTAGDKIPADGILVNSPGLMVDEAILTGESITVAKSNQINRGTPAPENQLWQGTLVTQGEGQLLVLDTGANTAYGKLGNLLENIIKIKTPLQEKIHRLVRAVAMVAVSVAVLSTVLITAKSGFVQGLLGGLTLAMSLIPEEFPVVFAVFLIMGVWRMTKKNALVREMAMVEILGSATVICTDKTGTLTEGKMALEKVYYEGKMIDKKDILEHSAHFAPFFKSASLSLEQVAIDPLEIEVQNFAKKMSINLEEVFHEHTLIEDLPFDSGTKMVHHLWGDKDDKCCLYSAGAPEAILAISNISEKEKKTVISHYESVAKEGYRIIAIGKKDCDHGKANPQNIDFLGLIAMSDPPRAGVKEAIDLCQKAGIRIIMITGDNKLTAHNIAENIGLKHNEELISGDEIDNLSPNAWQEMVRRHDIFTRVRPEQKYQIVEALQKSGAIVAMTGDGVNDAPALKKANIGIAMGQKGTEVARAAAGIILLDDNFTTIVHAVEEGRRIYDNLRQAFVFLFSFHIPIIAIAIIPLLFGQELIFLPVHIIFLELICDPAAVLGFEKELARRNSMSEPPRPINEPLINPKLWWKVAAQGLSISFVSLGLYYYFIQGLHQIEIARTMAFGSLVISQTFLIIFSREWHQVKNNLLLTNISIITLIVLAIILLTPILRTIFHLAELPLVDWVLMIILPLISSFFVSLFFKKFFLSSKYDRP